MLLLISSLLWLKLYGSHFGEPTIAVWAEGMINLIFAKRSKGYFDSNFFFFCINEIYSDDNFLINDICKVFAIKTKKALKKYFLLYQT